jgi:hypothetical protein
MKIGKSNKDEIFSLVYFKSSSNLTFTHYLMNTIFHYYKFQNFVDFHFCNFENFDFNFNFLINSFYFYFSIISKKDIPSFFIY